ncbi:MAG: TM0106 family RecB-like putative nuclease [Leptolyngbyaceae cyanobacterium bins.59]|nr:TM0106 family RecB-like putative nuclease [Leptolyngbyaceae cyanobacterium bins.59]
MLLLTAELLLYFQRCNRRAFLDVFGDQDQRDPPSDYLLKLIQDSGTHRKRVLSQWNWQQPDYPKDDWESGFQATVRLMQEGVECIHRGVLLAQETPDVLLLSQPDLLIRQPGQSRWGDWIYIPAEIKLGKRPKLEYQFMAAFDVHVLADIQEEWAETAYLLLREKGTYEVDLWKTVPPMQTLLKECIATLAAPDAPEVFIARNRCNLCSWYSQCYTIAQSTEHLSLLPGVTASRYPHLKAKGLTTVAALATTPPDVLETFPGFNADIAHKLVFQARSSLENRALVRSDVEFQLAQDLPTAEVELYFDIEAEPELNLAYLHGILVVDRRTGAETFHPLLAKQPENEPEVWQQFLDLVWRYPTAPIYHFCPYELQTIERLAYTYGLSESLLRSLRSRFVDLHERVTRAVVLPVESYALKPIVRWMGFEWRDPNGSGAQAICWYDQWLETGDRSYLELILRYNEDDCRAMRHLKDWLVEFLTDPSESGSTVEMTHPEPCPY